MTATTSSPRFVGRATGGAACVCCGRAVTFMYLIDEGNGPAPYGRRCASRTMGWATSRVEMEAVRVERMAELRRRRALIGAAFPVLATIERDVDANPADNDLYALRSLLYTASNEDAYWDETRYDYGRYGTWADYLTFQGVSQ